MFEMSLVRWAWPLGVAGSLLPRQCDPNSGGPGGAGSAGAPTAEAGAAGSAGADTNGGAGGQGGGATGSVVYVNPAREPGGDGSSWENALSDLQAAIDQQAAAGGGEVWVVGGEYESLTSEGQDLIRLRSGVS